MYAPLRKGTIDVVKFREERTRKSICRARIERTVAAVGQEYGTGG